MKKRAVLVLLGILIMSLLAPTNALSNSAPGTADIKSEEVLIQVKPTYPHRRFDEEYVRPQRVDIRDLTVQIEESLAAGRSPSELTSLIEHRDQLIAEVEAEKNALANEIIAYNARSFEPNLQAVEKFLDGLGVKSERGVDGVIQVRLPNALKAQVRSLPQVASLLPRNGIGVSLPDLDVSVPTVGATNFQTNGYSGSGIKIGVIDNGINTVDYVAVAGRKVCMTLDGSHGTGVAAVMAQNRAGSPLGVAPQVSIYDAATSLYGMGWRQAEVDTCVSWLASNGMHVANTSWNYGADSAAQNSYDWYGDRYAMVHTVSFGNTSDLSPGAPATSYNTVSVSASDDHNTTSRTDDSPATISLQGPLPDGRKRPDLSAPGVNITTLAGSLSGTSFSAPHIAGIAGLVTQSLLANGVTDNLQTRVRALLINSAENKRGTTKDPTYGWWHPQWGWGYLNGSQAYLDASSATPKTYISSVTQGGTTSLYFTATGGWNNVTLVWKRKMSDDKLTGWLSNLDLKVYNQATGLVVDASTSSVDNVEYVRFNGTAGTTYRIDVIGTSLSNTTSQYFGVASGQPLRTTP